MAVSGVPSSAPPLDLAAMEERLKRFDQEREATNQWLKSNFPEVSDLLKPGAVGKAKGKDDAEKVPEGVAALSSEDRYEGVQRNYHLRQDAMQRALEEGSQGCGPEHGGFPAVGRPRPGKSFAEAVEDMNAKHDQAVRDLMAEGFAENDLVDYMRDSAAKAQAKSFERGYQDREQLYQFERDNERRSLDRTIDEEAQRQRADLDRQRRDDDVRRDREEADRRRRDLEDADRRRRDLDAANARRDAERRDQEARDAQRRAEEDRLRADRDRG